MRYSEFINQTVTNRNRIEWNYYGCGIDARGVLDVNNPNNLFDNGTNILPIFTDPGSARSYIGSYFAAGGKKSVLSFDFDERHWLPDNRAIHTVSAFFLGLLIENCLTGEQTLSIQDSEDFPFSYLWFLTCLYHDYGYCVTERKNMPYNLPTKAPKPCEYSRNDVRMYFSEYTALNKTKKELKINLSPFGRGLPGNARSTAERAVLSKLTGPGGRLSKSNRLRFNTNSVVSSTRYDALTTARYFNYSINVRKHADHGIIGGFLFYDRMIKNYMLAYFAAMQECGCTPELGGFEYRNRYFCSKQLVIFSYIADCILSHNIFRQPTDGRQVYEEYKLEALYSENFKKVSFEDNPLLYILAVTDSIEPTKIYRGYAEPQSVIDAIDIEYIPGSREIKVTCASGDIDIRKLHAKAKELEDWTSADCSELHDNSFTLRI